MSDRYAVLPARDAASSAVEAASPASSTSTLRAAPTKVPGPDASAQRSRGQMARRQSVAESVGASYALAADARPRPPYAAASAQHKPYPRQRYPADYGDPNRDQIDAPHAVTHRLDYPDDVTQRSLKHRNNDGGVSGKRRRFRHPPQAPLLGGLYFSDLIVVAFYYALNLLRTCGLAELMDVAFKGGTYVLTRLAIDFWQRWSLSRYPSPAPSARTQYGQQLRAEPNPSRYLAADSGRASTVRVSLERGDSRELVPSTGAAEESSDDDEEDTEVRQLSPFHHLVILLTRFACTSFPHLLPRVLFAEETIGPLVRWRTGGGAAGIVREFTNEPIESLVTSSDAAQQKPDRPPQPAPPIPPPATFRAFWIGADAHVPVDVRRSDPESRRVTTLLYLHGGGFSLGSVAFYAEALIRIMAKVARLEEREGGSRCVAVEYDLSPSVRFPAPLLQCLRCYAHLVEVEKIDPSSITIAGDSAGANLAMSMLLCIDGQARNEPLMSERDWTALPMPGKAVFISPWADLRPSSSLAFAPLRDGHVRSRSHQSDKTGRAHDDPSRCSLLSSPPKPTAWAEAMAEYDWDYVAAEALMHFAQVYAGVLERPRRVRGPMGWVANLCAYLADDDDGGGGAAPQSGKFGSYDPLTILSRLVTPPTARLARVAYAALTEPLLDLSTKRFRAPGKPRGDPFEDEGSLQQGGLDPLFNRSERLTDAVASSTDLFVPTWACCSEPEAKGDDDGRWWDPEFREAVNRLENHVLISPTLGDWSRIRLKRGMLVTWGERERLAKDIEAWAQRVRSEQAEGGSGRRDASTAGTAAPSTPRGAGGQHDRPEQDRDEPPPVPSLQVRRAASLRASEVAPSASPPAPAPTQKAQWLSTAVEHGPSGVHAWPFVSMYLAGSEAEREKGLELIAGFVAKSAWPPPPSPLTRAESIQKPAAALLRDPLAMRLPARKTSFELLAPAHSPPGHDGLSPVGSLPSDVYDDDERHYTFHPRSREGSTDWDSTEVRNQLGLRGVDLVSPGDPYPHEPLWADPMSTSSSGTSSPVVDRDAAAATAPSPSDSAGAERDETASRLELGLSLPKSSPRPSSGGETDTGSASASATGTGPASLGAGGHATSADLVLETRSSTDDDDDWESDEAATVEAAPRHTAKVVRKRSLGAKKRTGSAATPSAASPLMGTPKAGPWVPSSVTEPSQASVAAALVPPLPSSALRLDPVHLQAPQRSTIAAAPRAEAVAAAVAASAASGDATVRPAQARPAIPPFWRSDDADVIFRQVPRGRIGVAQPTRTSPSLQAQVGQPGRVGMTLAEVEALEEAEEAAAAAAAAAASSTSTTAATSSAAISGSGTTAALSASASASSPLSRLSASRHHLARILGSAYESDGDGDDHDFGGDLDFDSDSDGGTDMGLHLGALASPHYVDDGSLSSTAGGGASSALSLSMDPTSYDLSTYSTARPEGLSDIAEEDSQFDASSLGITSPGVESVDGDRTSGNFGAGFEESRRGLAFTSTSMATLTSALQGRAHRSDPARSHRCADERRPWFVRQHHSATVDDQEENEEGDEEAEADSEIGSYVDDEADPIQAPVRGETVEAWRSTRDLSSIGLLETRSSPRPSRVRDDDGELDSQEEEHDSERDSHQIPQGQDSEVDEEDPTHSLPSPSQVPQPSPSLSASASASSSQSKDVWW
ncbi:hypothetical protein ACQY0O_003263 [Thecaphora frezii]